MPAVSGSRELCLDPLITSVSRRSGTLIPSFGGTRRSFVRWPARRKTGSRRRSVRGSRCSRRRRGAQKRADHRGRRVQALRHVRVPPPAHGGACGRGGLTVDVDRFASSSRNSAPAPATAPRRCRSASTPGGSSHDVRGIRDPWVRRLDRGDARSGLPRAPRRRRGSGRPGLPRPHPVLRGGGGQVGDRGVIRTPTGVIRSTTPCPRAIVRSCIWAWWSRARSGRARRRTPRWCRSSRSDRPSAHLHARRPRDAPRAARRPRPSGGIARRTRPPPSTSAPSAVSPEQLDEAELIANRRLTADDARETSRPRWRRRSASVP